MSTILIKKGYLLDPYLPFERSDILVEGDLISQVATNIDFKADTIIDASDKVIIPGLITAHTHTFGTPVRGLVDMIPTEPWLLYSQKYALGLL